MNNLYPMRLMPVIHPTIWGGRSLERFGWKRLPEGEVSIGETWETEHDATIENGIFAGQTLGEAVDHLGIALIGERALALYGERFPLLIKFTDIAKQTSIHVHPPDSYAAMQEPTSLGKAEFWYILHAEPGSMVTHGFRTITARTQVQEAIQKHTLEDLVHSEPVAPGDAIYVPPGTVHSVGKGIVLYEVQEYSDATYRLYDFGRLGMDGQPRPLHVEQSLSVTSYHPSTNIKASAITLRREPSYHDAVVVACPYFVTRKIVLEAQTSTAIAMPGTTSHSCVVLSAIKGNATIRYGQHFYRVLEIRQGQTIVLPAFLGDYQLAGSSELLLSYVPDLTDDAMRLWDEVHPPHN